MRKKRNGKRRGRLPEVKVISSKEMTLLPPPADKCQECAVDHPADQPHNAQSLFYQFKFQRDHGRGATWVDAIAHCDEGTKKLWESELRKMNAWPGPNPSKEAPANG